MQSFDCAKFYFVNGGKIATSERPSLRVLYIYANAMKQLLTILCLLTTCTCYGQYAYNAKKISYCTKRIVARIAKAKIVTSEHIGFGGSRSKQYDNFEKLACMATKKELEELTNHPNEAVRCYAFQALSYDNTADLLPIIIAHIHDTATVETFFGCSRSSEVVADYFISICTSQMIDLTSKKLTEKEMAVVDSILIYVPNNLSNRYRAIERAKPTPQLYPLIKKMVVTDKNLYALQPLARFRKEEDIPLILNAQHKDDDYEYLHFTYKAISNFPHPVFLALLSNAVVFVGNNKVRYSNIDELSNAIACFQNDTAARLLESLLTNVKDPYESRYIAKNILNTVQAYYAPSYNAILWQLLQNHNTTNLTLFKTLYKENQARALALAQKFILSADSAEYDYTGETDSIMSALLDTVKAHDEAAYKSLILKNIVNAQFHLFHVFTDRASKMKDSEIVSALFTRLEKEESPSVFEETAKTLLSFKDKQINQQLKDFPRKQSTTYNTTGYDDLPSLLKKYGIK